MKKYWQVVKNTWAEYMTYRLNFILWRVRRVLNLLLVYFLWSAIFVGQGEVFGYSQKQILTYILLSNIVASFVFATKTLEIGGQINSGDLTNFLLRPISYFKYWWARDFSDKVLNIFFSIVEVALLIFLFKPGVFLQTNLNLLFFFALSIILGIVLYFHLSFLLGFIGFWSPEVWAPRFIFFILTEFFVGGLFPLDILPKPLFLALQALPFPYLLYFPLKIYLGQLNIWQIAGGFAVSMVWLFTIYQTVQLVWQKGLRVYTAEGR